ncbi:MAG: hypothetical protein IJQ85_07985 [Selenomonadaceae bacterium]|nr:hypothetical protein [Selenomonadaceae bacterium]
MIYKKFFITFLAAIIFVTSTCAAAKIEVIDAEENFGIIVDFLNRVLKSVTPQS